MYETFVDLMKKHGVTAYKVSKDTGITQATLSRWKTGVTQPSRETLQILAAYFQVSVDYLLTGAPAGAPPAPARPHKTAPPAELQDDELRVYLEELRTRPEQRALFSLTKNATKEDVEKAVRIVDALLGGEQDKG